MGILAAEGVEATGENIEDENGSGGGGTDGHMDGAHLSCGTMCTSHWHSGQLLLIMSHWSRHAVCSAWPQRSTRSISSGSNSMRQMEH